MIKVNIVEQIYKDTSNNEPNFLNIKKFPSAPIINNNNLDLDKISQLEKENKELKNKLQEEKDQNFEYLKQLQELKAKYQISSLEKEKNLENQINNNILDFRNLNIKEELLSIKFVSIDMDNITKDSFICKNTDLFIKVEELLYEYFPILKKYDTSFFIRGRKIRRFKTLSDNQIKNNDVIHISINDD